MDKQNIFIGCPTHDGRLHYKTAEALYDAASQQHQLYISISQTSLLNWNCNQLWAQALNMRKQYNFKWFAMLHSDVAPERWWLDKLVQLAEQHNADMLSVCMAIKDNGGDVSTGISNPQNNHWNLKRLAIADADVLPLVFSAPDVKKAKGTDFDFLLLANTGCMIVRMDKPWSDQLIFKSEERITVNALGLYQAFADPEDWNFSRQIAQRGGNVMATYAIHADHIGGKAYTNQPPKENPVTIWSLNDAMKYHVHSPSLAAWLCGYLDKTKFVYDFGCGLGHYVKALREAGFIAKGIEGTEHIQKISATSEIFTHDLTQPLRVNPSQIICLEVMEHVLAGEQEHAVLTNIANNCSGTLVLSWAVPGQLGHGHNNCRPADYVVNRLAEFQFVLQPEITKQARQAVTEPYASFFKETLYVFKKP